MDGRGAKRVAPLTEERQKALEQAGYIQGGVSVPLTSGEKIMIKETAEKWHQMQEEAAKEAK